jgi:hypothetical protein
MNARLVITAVVLIGAATLAWHWMFPLWGWAVTDREYRVIAEWLDPMILLLCALLLLPSVTLGFLVAILGRPRNRLVAGVSVGFLFVLLQLLRAKFYPTGDASLLRYDFRYWACAVGLLGPVVGAGIAGLVATRLHVGLPSNNRWRGP